MWFHQQNEQRAEAARQMSPWEAWPRVLEERTSLSRVWQARSCHPSVASLPSLSKRLEGRASPSKSPHRISWASPTGTVAWGRPPICSSLMPVQNRSLRCCLLVDLFLRGIHYLRRGLLGEKIPMVRPRGKHWRELCLSLWRCREALEMWLHASWGRVSLHLCNPVPHTVPGAPQALN